MDGSVDQPDLPMIPADYHMHLFPDNEPLQADELQQRLQLYARVARARGVAEIGISEHVHRFRQFREIMRYLYDSEGVHPDIRGWLTNDFGADLDFYVDVILSTKADVPVRLGLEVDYLPGHMEAVREVLSPYPWDYLLGSVHFLGTWSFDMSPDIGWPDDPALVDAGWLRYWHTWRDAASCGLFSSMAHPDLFKKFGHRPSTAASQKVAEAQAAALSTVARAGVAIEINSSGLRKPVREVYPSVSFLHQARSLGIPVTLGSDAHQAEDVGRGLREATELARGVGYREVTLFRRRQQATARLP